MPLSGNRSSKSYHRAAASSHRCGYRCSNRSSSSSGTSSGRTSIGSARVNCHWCGYLGHSSRLGLSGNGANSSSASSSTSAVVYLA